MERLSRRDYQLLLEFLRDLESIDESRPFVDQLLPMLQRLVPYDVITYNAVDLDRGRNPTVTYPAGVMPADAERLFAPFIGEHPIIRHIERTHDRQTRKLSDLISQRQFQQLGIYRDFFRLVGVEHQIALTLPAPAPIVLGIALNRHRLDFSERERLLLNLSRPHLVASHSRAEARSRIMQTFAALEQALEADARGIIVVDRNGRAPQMTAQAYRWMADYFDSPRRRFEPLPPDLAAWLRLQQGGCYVEEQLPNARTDLILHRGDRSLTIRYLPGADGVDADLLLLSEVPAAATLQPEHPRLTDREEQVLQLLAQGKTDRQIADQLAVSRRTVQKHVEHLLAKLGVRNRTAAAIRAPGYPRRDAQPGERTRPH